MRSDRLQLGMYVGGSYGRRLIWEGTSHAVTAGVVGIHRIGAIGSQPLALEGGLGATRIHSEFDSGSVNWTTSYRPYLSGALRLESGQGRFAYRLGAVAFGGENDPLFLLLEAPGPWGCRFSGVPVTSEAQLTDPNFPIDGRPTSREDEPHTEYSASIFWRVCRPHFPRFFVWNSMPLHPHDPDEPLSIRTPRRTEVREWQDLLTALLDVLAPSRIVGVGRKAERALDEAGAAPTYVRHPSQGGAHKFEAGITAIVEDLGL